MNFENDDDDIIEENINYNKKERERLFSFSTINKYYLMPFLCPIFLILCNININIIIKIGENNIIFLSIIIESLSLVLAGLLTFIPSLREKTKYSKNDALIYKKNK